MNELIVVDVKIRQDAEGRFCLNDLHRAAGGEERHKPANWMRTQQTQAMIEELLKEQSVAQIRATEQKQPLMVYQGWQLPRHIRLQGTGLPLCRVDKRSFSFKSHSCL